MSDRYPADRPSIVPVRRDRRPRNSSARFHEIADQWFRSNFGVSYRSQAVFITSKILTASAYARAPEYVMRVIPLTAYRFCWSPKVKDLLFVANRHSESSREEIEIYLNSLDYRENDLTAAHEVGNEVMLFCEKYVAIPVSQLGVDLKTKNEGLILIE